MTQLQNSQKGWLEELEEKRNLFLKDKANHGKHQWDAILNASSDDIKVLSTALLKSLQPTQEEMLEMDANPCMDPSWSEDKRTLAFIARLRYRAKYRYSTFYRKGWMTLSKEKFPSELKIGLSKQTIGLIGEILEQNSTETNN